MEQLGGALGESGLLVLPCVAAHINQVSDFVFYFLFASYIYIYFLGFTNSILEEAYTKLLVQIIIDSFLVNFWLQKDRSSSKIRKS